MFPCIETPLKHPRINPTSYRIPFAVWFYLRGFTCRLNKNAYKYYDIEKYMKISILAYAQVRFRIHAFTCPNMSVTCLKHGYNIIELYRKYGLNFSTDCHDFLFWSGIQHIINEVITKQTIITLYTTFVARRSAQIFPEPILGAWFARCKKCLRDGNQKWGRKMCVLRLESLIYITCCILCGRL